MRFFLLPTAALVCCVSSGCVSENTRAYNAAQTFLSALSRGDSAAAQAVATKAARPNLAGFLKNSSSVRGEFTLDAAQLSEGAAEVPVTFTGSSPRKGRVLLRREENEWRVWALRVKADQGPELTLDFEHPERMVGEVLGVAVGELAKHLEGLGKDTEKAGKAFGEALGGFVKGFAEGVEKSAPTPKPTVDNTLTPPVLK